MGKPLEPLKIADLPDRKTPFWKMTGPAAVLAGLSIGSGELVVWPWITAKFGAGMAWAAMIGVFLQLFVNIEIGRWAISTGESPFTGFARAWKGFALVFLGFNIILTFLPGWAHATGIAFKVLITGSPESGGPDWAWTAGTFVVIALILFGPKTMYTALERAIAVFVITIVVGLIIVAVRVGTLDAAGELARGVVNFGNIQLDDTFTFPQFFGAIVFAGAGGLGNLFYAYYLRDKHIGMGSRIPRLYNPLQGAHQADIQTGYIFNETEDNVRRFKDWFRYVKLDQTMYFWLLSSFLILLFMFASLTVLRPQGIVPDQDNFLWDEAAVLGEIMGNFGVYLFLIIGMAALFSTQLTVVDGGARVMAELIRTAVPKAEKIHQNSWYLYAAIFAMVMGVFATWLFSQFTALGVLLNNALLNGFAMAIYVPLLLVINISYLPKQARPHLFNIIMVAIAAAVYIAFALFVLYLYTTGLIAGFTK